MALGELCQRPVEGLGLDLFEVVEQSPLLGVEQGRLRQRVGADLVTEPVSLDRRP